MDEVHQLKFSSRVLLIPTLLILLLWGVYVVEIYADINFNKWGVFPRTALGLRGVFFTHFIHGSVSHLFNNSVPLFVLLASLFYFYRTIAFRVLVYGAILTGFLTWIFARESYHIGASGVVYLLFSYILFSGIFKKHYRLVALSFAIIFLYGSMIWYVFPIKEGMSWEGHLSGFLVGLFYAFIYRNEGLVKKPHQFTETDFDLLFDENGNFSPPNPNIEDRVEERY